MEQGATRSSLRAQHEALGRRVDPNNLSRAECKVLIEAICRREQETGRNILTEMWERYDRHVLPPLLRLLMHEAMQGSWALDKFKSNFLLQHVQGRLAATHRGGQI